MNKENMIISKPFVKLSINIAKLRQKNPKFSKILGIECTNLVFFKS